LPIQGIIGKKLGCYFASGAVTQSATTKQIDMADKRMLVHIRRQDGSNGLVSRNTPDNFLDALFGGPNTLDWGSLSNM
jgi:hypothetical protein